MDDVLLELRRGDGALIYCPNGHAQLFGRSPVKKLAEVNEKLAEATEEIRNLKIEVTRLRCELANKPKTLMQTLGLTKSP